MADVEVTDFPNEVFGTKKIDLVDHFGPASYATGGEEFPPAALSGVFNDLGFSKISVLCGSLVTEDGLYRLLPQFPSDGSSPATVTLKWIVVSTGDEVASTTDLSASHARILLIGG